MKCKARGAQQPECTLWYMRIASTSQRRNSPEQRIYRSALKGNDYRLVVSVAYKFSAIYIKFIGTHAQYDAVDAETIELEQ